jgi:hypothetical protein
MTKTIPMNTVVVRSASYNPDHFKTVIDDLHEAGDGVVINYNGLAFSLDLTVGGVLVDDLSGTRAAVFDADELKYAISERMETLEMWANTSMEEAGLGDSDRTLLEHYGLDQNESQAYRASRSDPFAGAAKWEPHNPGWLGYGPDENNIRERMDILRELQDKAANGYDDLQVFKGTDLYRLDDNSFIHIDVESNRAWKWDASDLSVPTSYNEVDFGRSEIAAQIAEASHGYASGSEANLVSHLRNASVDVSISYGGREFRLDGYDVVMTDDNGVEVRSSAHAVDETIGIERSFVGKSLTERFERGLARPSDVTNERWEAVKNDYFHNMTLENTDDEFIPGTSAYLAANYGDHNDDYGPVKDEYYCAAKAFSHLKVQPNGSTYEIGNSTYTIAGNIMKDVYRAPESEEVSYWTAGDPISLIEDPREIAFQSILDGKQATADIEALVWKRQDVSIAPNHVIEQAQPVEVAKPAEPAKAFDLSNMMGAATLPNSQQGEMQPDHIEKPARTTPSFMKSRRPDFTTQPTKAPEKAAAKETKLTPESRIIRLDDRGIKQPLASEEAKKQGPEVSVERKAFTVSGNEIVSSYEMTKEGKVIVTDYDGSKSEMTFAQARRHELETLSQMNRNALSALNMMMTNPAFTVRQGDATFSVQNGFFCQKLDNGKFKKEPLAQTRERWNTRIREVDAMLPKESSRKFAAMAERASEASKFTQVQTKSQTAEQGMR